MRSQNMAGAQDRFSGWNGTDGRDTTDPYAYPAPV